MCITVSNLKLKFVSAAIPWKAPVLAIGILLRVGWVVSNIRAALACVERSITVFYTSGLTRQLTLAIYLLDYLHPETFFPPFIPDDAAH